MVALQTLSFSEWKSRAQVIDIQWCLKPVFLYMVHVLGGPSFPAIPCSTFPLYSEYLKISWTIPSYSLNTLEYNCGLSLHDTFCHLSVWHPVHAIPKFHNFLTFSSSVIIFSTLFQPSFLWTNLDCGITAPPMKTYIQLFHSLTSTSYPFSPVLLFSDFLVYILHIHWVLQPLMTLLFPYLYLPVFTSFLFT